MANHNIQLKIVTPERLVFEETVDSLTVPTENGEIGILPNHIPLISAITQGDIVAMKSNEPIPFAVVGGFVQVKPDEVVILADFSEYVSNLSEDDIAIAKDRAEKAMNDKEKLSHEEFEHFNTQLERALTSGRVRGKWKGKKYKKINF